MEETQALCTSRSLVTACGTPTTLCVSRAREVIVGTESSERVFHGGQPETSHRERISEAEFWKTVCRALKCTGRGADKGDGVTRRTLAGQSRAEQGRAEQDAAARHPPPWALAAFSYCLAPASSQEISGRETSVLGRSPKPEASPSVGIARMRGCRGWFTSQHCV